jgi:hypothetical protein
MRFPSATFFLAFCLTAVAQTSDVTHGPFEMEISRTTASLRGVHAVGGGVVWASGSGGTVLRSEDEGIEWQNCVKPPGAEQLDFRGVWAWDANTATVMSSGPGDQSRLYKTTDGCATWKLLFTNPDKDGFWDGIAFTDEKNGYLLGDPVDGKIVLMRTEDGGAHWKRISSNDLAVSEAKTGFFAASNSSMVLQDPVLKDVGLPWLGTGSAQAPDGTWRGPYVLHPDFDCDVKTGESQPEKCDDHLKFKKEQVPIAGGSDAAGVFSLDIRYDHGGIRKLVAVGGDYKKPNSTEGTAAWSSNGGPNWVRASKPPHGYRSAVQYDLHSGAWITAGPNGSDYSMDDGKTWRPLDDGNWNAISLPWFVGPNGRIGKLVSLAK